MARITVEDCLDYVDNRFHLVLVATKRARQLSNGVAPLLPWEKDKPTVMALREIAAGVLNPSTIARQPLVSPTQSVEATLSEELRSIGDG